MEGLKARIRQDGIFICEFVGEDGERTYMEGSTADEAIAAAVRYITKYGGRPIKSGNRGPYGKRGPNTSGKQWGRPTNKQLDYKQQLEQVFGDIKARAVMAASATAGAINAKVTEAAAKALVQNVYKIHGKYNTYTGNLERAYMATVVQGRRVGATVYVDNTPKGNPVVRSKKGKPIVYLFGKPRHPLGKVKQNSYRRWNKKRRGLLANDQYERVPYRYFKYWENKKGYRDRNYLSKYGGWMGGFGYLAGDNRNRIQSGIVLQNTAPYADAVNKRYRVMPTNAMMRSYSIREGSRQTQLLTVITKKMLVAAGLI